jgi:hypothetical protein
MLLLYELNNLYKNYQHYQIVKLIEDTGMQGWIGNLTVV